MVDNTDFEADINSRIKEAGLDKAPDFEFLNAGKFSSGCRRHPRLLKTAGFIFAVFAVSTLMTIVINSDFAMAAGFRINGMIFDIKNGFLISDVQFDAESVSQEILIEDETQIAIGQEYLEQLKIPGYIPDGYEFVSLSITDNPQNEYVAMYSYENGQGDMVRITQEKLAAYNSNPNFAGIEDDFFIGEAHVLYIPDVVSNYKSICVFTEFEEISINGRMELPELLEIYGAFE